MSETAFTPLFVADLIKWERVILNIVGRLRNIPADSVDFMLTDSQSGQRVKLNDVLLQGDRFLIRFNMITAYPDRTVLPNGKWSIDAISREGGVVYPLVAGDRIFSDEGYEDDYVGLSNFDKLERFKKVVRKGASSSYTLAVTMSQSGELALESELIVPPKKNALCRAASTIKRLFKPITDYLLHRGFNIIFKVTSLFARHKGNRLLFASDSRKELSGNMKDVYDRMVERGIDKQFKIHFSLKENVNTRRGFIDKIRTPYLLAAADIIIIDDFNPTVKQCKYKPSVKVIQLWHACGAFKTVGFSRTGKSGGPFVTNNNHRVYTHAIASSSHVARFYAEAFGMTKDMVYPTGVPRTDVFFDENYRRDTRERMLSEVPAAKGKRVILFAPTFRGNGAKSGKYPMNMLDMAAIAKMCRDTNSIFIFKMHPFVHNPVIIPEEFSDVIIDCTAYREINDLLFITDLLITDYSSVVYEASTLDIPMLFYAYDLEKYISSRDFYEPFETFVPGKIVIEFEDMIKAIYEGDFEQEKVAPFCERNFEFRDGGSTDRVIDWLILGNLPEGRG